MTAGGSAVGVSTVSLDLAVGGHGAGVAMDTTVKSPVIRFPAKP